MITITLLCAAYVLFFLSLVSIVLGALSVRDSEHRMAFGWSRLAIVTARTGLGALLAAFLLLAFA